MKTSKSLNNSIDFTTLFSAFPDLMSLDDVAKALGISRQTAYILVKEQGVIQSIRVGHLIRIPRPCLIDYVTRQCYNQAATVGQPADKEV